MTGQIGLLAACLALAAAGAAWDVRIRRIPNGLCLLLAVMAAAYAWWATGANGLLWGAAHAAIALAVGIGLFALGVIGGGDAKFYAAAALAVPLKAGFTLLGWTSAAGLVLLVVLVAGKLLFASSGKSMREMRKMPVPYGVAIAAGFALTTLA
jgi:prepilin peptidase CpaA